MMDFPGKISHSLNDQTIKGTNIAFPIVFTSKTLFTSIFFSLPFLSASKADERRKWKNLWHEKVINSLETRSEPGAGCSLAHSQQPSTLAFVESLASSPPLSAFSPAILSLLLTLNCLPGTNLL